VAIGGRRVTGAMCQLPSDLCVDDQVTHQASAAATMPLSRPRDQSPAERTFPVRDRLSVTDRWSPRWRPNGLRFGVGCSAHELVDVGGEQPGHGRGSGPPWLDGYGLGETAASSSWAPSTVAARRRPGSATRVAANRGCHATGGRRTDPAAPTVGTLSRTSPDPSRQSVGVSRRLRAGCAQPQTPGVRCPLTQ